MGQPLPDPSLFLNKILPNHPNYQIIEHLGKGGNAHVFKAYDREINLSVAVKIIPEHKLSGGSESVKLWLSEAQKANRLSNNRVIHYTGSGLWEVPDEDLKAVYFLMDYVDGPSVEKLIKDQDQRINMGFINQFLIDMMDFLFRLQKEGLNHGDFHAGNVLVTSTGGLDNRLDFKVTDFGPDKLSIGKEVWDDTQQVGHMLNQMLGVVETRRGDLSALDRFIFNFHKDELITKYLLEEDTVHVQGARDPKAIHELIITVKDRFYKIQSKKQSQGILGTPFEYLSCEQIGDDEETLQALFSDKYLSSDTLTERNNLILTGPRGCGKTTLFRALSLQHRIAIKKDAPEELERFLGIYYHCQDLMVIFPRYKLPENEQCWDVPLHFVSATLMVETLEQLSIWGHIHFQDIMFRQEKATTHYIIELLQPSIYTPIIADNFDDLARYLRSERPRLHELHRACLKQEKKPDAEKHIDFADIRFFTPATFLKFVSIIRQNLSFMASRPLYFFVDDYGQPKISKDLQKNLNRLFMQRDGNCFFKMSTESQVSFSNSDINGTDYTEQREYVLLDLGVEYLTEAGRRRLLPLLEDIFDRRFTQVRDFPADSIEKLVGSNDRKFNQLARDIIGGTKQIQHWGKETLAHLCTGDIHIILDLVKTMVENSGGPQALVGQNKAPLISKDIQHQSIRQHGGQLLSSLDRHINGVKLNSIVNAFGEVAYHELLTKTSKNLKMSPPKQAGRIEPSCNSDDLPEEAKGLLNELIRHGIFIRDIRGKSINNTRIHRYYLRRLLLPYYNLSFSGRDSIFLNIKELNMFLSSPDVFIKYMKGKKLSDQPVFRLF